MFKSLFKNLTLIFVTVGTFSLQANILNQKEFKTHLRWTIKSDKKQILVKKDNERITLQTLDTKLFNALTTELIKTPLMKNYISQFEYDGKNLPAEPGKITIQLKDDSIELFTFFKDQEKAHILDFWINQDVVATKEAAVVKKPQVIKVAKAKPVKKVKPKKKPKVKKVASLNKMTDVLDPEKILEKSKQDGFRDFRYGAAFVWNYNAFIPPLEKDINLAVKAPDFLYQVKDRELLEDKKEAHMQLSINFYRKEKWGLMTRSIGLYEKKYGNDKNKEINDFMKATSMIKNLIKPSMKTVGLSEQEKAQIEAAKASEMPIPAEFEVKISKKGTFQAAVNILMSVIDRTSDYELKKASLRFILQSTLNEQDYIKSLQLGKSLYVSSSEQFDDEMIIYSSRVILYSLANLKQLNKIQEFLSNKAVMRVLPKQEGLAYISYVHLAKNKESETINLFESNRKSLAKPVHPVILFNTAEAYFRSAKYEKALKLYDAFLVDYSFYQESSKAYLRIALCYDLLDASGKKVLTLYKNAINRATDPAVRYEAKLRYVGMRVARKRSLTDKDREVVVFLDQTKEERKVLNQDLRKLLWTVRMRTMINDEKFDDALAYLSTIPLESLRLVEQRTFEGDGAEVVLGLVQDAYLKEDYARAVKVWEVYKDKYESKVAKSPYMSFIVSDSFLKLGLTKSFERSFENLKGMKQVRTRTFPRWVNIRKNIKLDDYIAELELGKMIASKQWKLADKFLAKNKSRKNINYNFYRGLVFHHLKKYNESVTSYEKILVTPNINNILSPRQSNTMLTTYIESLYQSNNQIRFRKNSAALINDLRRIDNKKYGQLLERAEYLYIESLYGDKITNFKRLSEKTNEFLKSHEKSTYKDRVAFLRGTSLIQISETEAGKNILQELLNKEGTPEYLKGLARTELSALALKNNTL